MKILLMTTGFLKVFTVKGLSNLYTICIKKSAKASLVSRKKSKRMEAKRIVRYIESKIPRAGVNSPIVFTILKLFVSKK
jgi:hypothetical protein